MDLNESQRQAVAHNGSHLLIAAGPGTGKTLTLTHRIAYLVSTLESSQRILAITFTNKAARQMKDGLRALGVDLSQVFVGTFHSFCLKLLRDYFEHTALPKDFKVAAEEDIGVFDKKVHKRISFLKSSQLVIIPDEEYKTYQRYLRQNSLIDFDDILCEALLLLEDENIAAQLRRQYPYILVDEYQDSNIVQNALLKILAREGVLLTVAGDVNQSIDSSRGSRVDLIKRFGEDFSPSWVMTLPDNYRSAPSRVIYQAATDWAEADYVAHEIEKYNLRDVAILYRLDAQRYILCQVLEHLKISYQVAQKPKKQEIYSDEDALGQNEETMECHVEKVSLMSLQAAKGLEFPVVFIIGFEDHLLPLDLTGVKLDLKEEQRLFYVGMTRAKEKLYLTFIKRRLPKKDQDDLQMKLF